MAHEGLFNDFEFFLGKEFGAHISRIQTENKLEKVNGIKPAFEELSRLGFGNTKIVSLSKHSVILKNSSSSIARQYSKSIFDDKTKVDYFIAGTYSGILSEYFEEEMDLEEAKCHAQGAGADCMFINANIYSDRHDLRKPIKDAIEKCAIEYLGDYPHIFSNMMLKRGSYSNQDGIVRLANIYHVFFRFGFYALSNNILSNKFEDVKSLHEYVGYINGKTAVDFLKNQFGRTNPDEIFTDVLKQVNMFGYGIGSIYSKSKDGIVARFEQILLMKQALRYMEKFEDPFIKGLILGLATVYGKKIGRFDFEQESDGILSMKINFENGDIEKDLISKIKSEKIKSIIDERMTHKYYLSIS